MTRKTLITSLIGGAAAVAAIAGTALPGIGETAEAAVNIPAPAINVPATRNSQTAVLAGGCFWGMEAVFQHVEGVSSVISGYAGGSAEDANYRAVSGEHTGHAEAIRITYDPSQVSYGRLLQIYFSVAHDPTQVNRQGPDTGQSYRSAIFPQSDRQRQVAQRYIAQLNDTGRFARPLATRIETGQFYRAEDSHQNFATRNPNHPYIRAYDVAKVRDFRQSFPSLYRADPAA